MSGTDADDSPPGAGLAISAPAAGRPPPLARVYVGVDAGAAGGGENDTGTSRSLVGSEDGGDFVGTPASVCSHTSSPAVTAASLLGAAALLRLDSTNSGPVRAGTSHLDVTFPLPAGMQAPPLAALAAVGAGAKAHAAGAGAGGGGVSWPTPPPIAARRV